MRILKILTILTLVSCLIACRNNKNSYNKTQSGFSYNIIKASNNVTDCVHKNNIIKVLVHQYIDDSLLSGAAIMPTYIKLDDNIRKFDFPEILHLMCINDSAVCLFSTKEVIKRGKESNKSAIVPNYLLKGKNVVVKLKVLQQFIVDSLAKQDYNVELEKHNATMAIIEKENEILDKAGLEKAALRFDNVIKTLPNTTVKLRNGVYVHIIKKGEGKKIIAGNEIYVSYKGFLDNGNFFESTAPDKPYKLHIGQNESIEGFDTGIESLTIGDSAHIYVPATLAYGKNAAGDKIPKYANLVFKVRVADKK
jgi:FKBP-type peptidyl-prolyl cis-trans isomerase